MEKIKIFNTLGRKKEEFSPIKEDVVGIYYCGPTVYWTQHIGNLRGAFCADSVRRVFEYNDYKVKFVRNYTDVGHLTSDEDEGEDKIEKGVLREGLTPENIAEKYIKLYEKDVGALNLLEPDSKPRATKYINEMQKMVKTLLNKGFAYSTGLAIYFDISKARNYTSLSRQRLEDNVVGMGKGDIADPQKKNPRDFAVWFFRAGKHKNALQYWNSEFKSNLVDDGEGFPGWHLECSAMSKEILGETVDVHIGGLEHIPVHHTNEIAQSESANGVKFVNYWIHNEHLLVNGSKMSKSEGTSYSLGDIKDKGFLPVHLKYFFSQAHYRSKQNFTWEALLSSKNGFEHLINQIKELGMEIGKVNQKFKIDFLKFINNDFNLPRGLTVIQDILKSDISKEDKLASILDIDRVFGFNIFEIINAEENIPQEIIDLVNKREEARLNKLWDEADNLREQIKNKGYIIEDSKENTKIKKI